MSLEKENMDLGYRYLLILGSKICLRRILPGITEGKWRLFLDQADTGLLSEVALVFEVHQGCWQVEGKTLSEKSPFYIYTVDKEKLLFLISKRPKYLEPSGKIFPKAGERIKIGNAYTSQIFYDCFSMVEAVHAKILCKEQGIMVIVSLQDGVYINGKAFKGEKTLHIGDRVDIYGLHILLLKEMIVSVSFCGVCRVAENKAPSEKLYTHNEWEKEQKQGKRNERQESFVERNQGQEEALHTGEVEVIVPDKPAAGQRQSLFLSLGPTLTMVLPMLLMAQLSSHYMEGMGNGFYYMSVVMSGCSAVLAVFWGLVNQWYGKYCRKQEEKEREQQYREYLKGTEEYLLNCQRENRRILGQRYPSFTELYKEDEKAAPIFWNRYYRQKDFLFFRLGMGETDFQMQIKMSGGSKRVVQGKLVKEAEEMIKSLEILTQVPVGVDLYENRQIGVMGTSSGKECKSIHEKNAKEVLLSLLLQIVVCHCYTEVKIACFYSGEKTLDKEIAKFLKWVPHCWSADRRTRFLAGSEQEAAEILPILTREVLKNPEGGKEGIKLPWYVVVVLEKELILGEALYQCLTDPQTAYPVSAIFAGEGREALPKSCRCFLTENEKTGEIMDLGSGQLSRQQVTFDVCSFAKAQAYAREITGFRVVEKEEDGNLPEQVDFLQLFGCRIVEELESGSRWQMARPEERLKVPIGYSTGGNLISLDVHEKFHGPHGLVAGTTGSGKSELLQTYLLSIAVSYSPADVNFFMIDYKGGGTGNILRGLPHCAGVISNLSGKQIKRAMSAIASENKRRQKLLGEYQVNHIDAYSRIYREGKAEKPMPHLILVVDEFAELKKEEPEFMQEIISLAQVGRSLGVHLVLATQKPAGTVDDKIWSNARFRLCLKVQDQQDSMDMLKNKDAAELTAPGQCYMQIGNHEYYELFQAGYCGGIYREDSGEKPGAVLVSNTGRRKEHKQETDASMGRSQIQVLIDYINQISKKWNYEPASSLWMPELPEKITTEVLRRQENQKDNSQKMVKEKKDIQVLLGLCDDPENQQQFTFFYEPFDQGHLAVFGGPGTGKTTLLQTIIWQLCKEYMPWQVQVLAVSMGQESFGCFLDMPGCLSILKEREEKEVFFYHLKKLVSGRREQLNGIGCQQYNQRNVDRLPYIFLVIDNFGSLARVLEEAQEEFLLKLVSEGIGLGIYLILSATAINELSGRLFEKIKTTLALEMSDRFQYGDVLRQYYLPVLPKENQKGRGLCKVNGSVLEFQSAVALGEMEDYERIDLISETGRKRACEMQKERINIPNKFPALPKKPEFPALARDYEWKGERLPIGYCLATGTVWTLSMKEAPCFLIVGNERTGRTALLNCMIESVLRLGKGTVIIDQSRRLGQWAERKEAIYISTEDELENWQKLAAEAVRENRDKQLTGVFISDMGSFCHSIYRFGEGKEERVSFWEQLAMRKKKGYFLAGIYNPARDMEAMGSGFFREFTAWQWGICLGGNLASQRVFAFDDLSYAIQNQYQPQGSGYVKSGPGSTARKLLLPSYEKGVK